MAVQIEPGTPLGVTLRQAIFFEWSSARRELEKRSAPSDHDLHEARKHIKRARALLRLVSSELVIRASADLRRVAQTLGPAREESAELECLRALASDSLAADLAAPIHELVERLQAARAVAPGGVAFGRALSVALPELSSGLERLASWQLPERGFALLAQGLQRTYARGRRALGRGLAEPSAEHLHGLRRYVKAQFFQLQLLEPAWPGPLASWRAELDVLAKALGEHHDLSLLTHGLGRRVTLPSALEQQLLGERVAARLAALEAVALPLAQRLYLERPRRFVTRHAEYHALWLEQPR